MLARNYTIEKIQVPPQVASLEDFQQIVSMGSGASNSMLFTLIVPFCFMLFMSVSMNRVWSIYNMLQILSNFINLRTLSIPGNSFFIIKIIQNVSFFSILSEENVQRWLEVKIFKHAQKLQLLLFGQGTLVTGMLFMGGGLAVVALGMKIKKFKGLFEKMKSKLMWSSVLRA